MANIAIYTPFLPLIGGGERYLLTLASALQRDHRVSFLNEFAERYQQLATQLEIDTTQVEFVPISAEKREYLIQQARSSKTANYDIFFCLSNHPYPSVPGLGTRNILIIQFPYPYSIREWRTKLREKPYQSSYHQAIVYSKFAEAYVNSQSQLPTHIIYPPVETHRFSNVLHAQQRNQILSVGRFIGNKDSKRQLEMVRFFKTLCDRYPALQFEYICAGSTRPEPVHQAYVDQIRQEAAGYPIHLKLNSSLADLMQLYAESKFFWHAKGYGAPKNRPEFTEHFGISTVEAMAAGCIPIVFAAGGQLEIVQEGKTGFLWRTEEDAIEKTAAIAQNPTRLNQIAEQARTTSNRFSVEQFTSAVQQFVVDCSGAEC